MKRDTAALRFIEAKKKPTTNDDLRALMKVLGMSLSVGNIGTNLERKYLVKKTKDGLVITLRGRELVQSGKEVSASNTGAQFRNGASPKRGKYAKNHDDFMGTTG